MTWSYGGDPANSTTDRVRFLCGDTDTTNQQVTNEEIAFLLSESNSDAYLAAASACDAMASKVAAKADYSRSVGDLSISTQYGSQATTLLRRAESLRFQASRQKPPAIFVDPNVGYGDAKFAIDLDQNEGFDQ